MSLTRNETIERIRTALKRRSGKHGSIYTKEVSIGRPPLNGCMCQDGSCESCNRLVEAFEAMREALGTLSGHIDSLLNNSTDALALEPGLNISLGQARAALALADEASRVTPTCDAQDHSTEAEYQACRICHPIDEAAKGKR